MKNILLILTMLSALVSCEAQIQAPAFWGVTGQKTENCYNYKVVIRGGDPSFLLTRYIKFVNCYGETVETNLSQTGETQTIYICASQMLTTVSTPIDPFYVSIGVVSNCDGSPITPPDTPVIPCGGGVNYNGGQAFPSTQTIQIGSSTGTVSVWFDPQGIPDKMIIKRQNGDVLLNTGYRTNFSSGSSNFNAQQSNLNSSLNSRGLPNETLQSNVSSMTYTFNKNFSDPYIVVEIWAPASSTGWEFRIDCL